MHNVFEFILNENRHLLCSYCYNVQRLVLRLVLRSNTSLSGLETTIRNILKEI